MKKDDIIELTIEDLGIDGEGIGKADGMALFVKDAVVGDWIRAKIMKMKKNYGYARLLEVLEPSPVRCTSRCEFARQCGGCQLQAMTYEAQLDFKAKKVWNHLTRIGGLTDLAVPEIIGMEDPWRYRNKAQFPFGTDKEGNVVTGFYAARSHNIIPCTECWLGVEENREILEIQIQGIKKHVDDTKRNAKEVTLIWQDTHQMLSGIAALAKEGNSKAILDLISESTELNRISTPTHYCSDPILNATLTAYLERARNFGITIEHHLAIPESLPIDSAELSICFANALENATKACTELPENERKIIIRCICRPGSTRRTESITSTRTP